MDTPYELGGGNETTTYNSCIEFYKVLAEKFPLILRLECIGFADGGNKLYVGIVSADGVFDRKIIKDSGRPIFFNNNGIHPGEPEGIDVCMAIVRNFCTQPTVLQSLGATIYLFIPIYNVDGCLNRNNTSRVNQVGPESFGFRANALNLDQNRDFLKCDSLTSQAFNQLITAWDPDVMVDTHTSNGADYQHTMTLIHTQPEKLGGSLGPFLKGTMLPAIYDKMESLGWPTCPYVNTIKDVPEDGIEDFVESPRYSTGYTALHSIIGFMPETHMLKPYVARYDSMKCIVEAILEFTVNHGAHIREMRRQDRLNARETVSNWPLSWEVDYSKPFVFRFRGYKSMYSPSKLGSYSRLSYDRSQPWEADIPYYNTCQVAAQVENVPIAYVIPQAYKKVILRLEWNGVECHRIATTITTDGQRYYFTDALSTKPSPYEGRTFHTSVEVEAKRRPCTLSPGDYLVIVRDQLNPRYVVETLEPLGADSYFRWGFFNGVLEKKEWFSAYVFEDEAMTMLNEEPALLAAFETWKAANPHLLASQEAVLRYLYLNCAKYQEPEYRCYPVMSLFDLTNVVFC